MMLMTMVLTLALAYQPLWLPATHHDVLLLAGMALVHNLFAEATSEGAGVTLDVTLACFNMWCVLALELHHVALTFGFAFPLAMSSVLIETMLLSMMLLVMMILMML